MRKYILYTLVLALIATIGCATTVSDKTPEAFNKRGIEHARSGEYQQAIKDFNQTIRLDSNNAKAYFSRGHVHYNLGKKDCACDDWQKACDL